MTRLNELLNDLGISKVRLSKYLGVSRQMLYNYLALEKLEDWPKEKATKLMSLLNLRAEEELSSLIVDGPYIVEVETRLNEGVKDNSNKDILADLKNLNKKEQELLTDIINYLKEKLSEDETKETFQVLTYLYHYLQSMETAQELKYVLGYFSKSMGFTDALEFAFNKEKQYILEAVLFSSLSIYNNGTLSKTKIADIHKKFVQDINQKQEEKLSRTQELNTANLMALKELGYTEINEENAREVFDKIAEILTRKV